MTTGSIKRGFRLHVGASAVVLVVAVWLSSGTMAPYASTFFRPIVSSPCGYLYNVDHPQHEAAFLMLDGAPRARWDKSMVLRRILFPLVAYPFMKVGGFEAGGFVASVLVQLAGLFALALHLRRRHGDGAALAGAWLYALSPGITYWAALPYAYVTIIPGSIALFILLTRLDERAGIRPTAAVTAAMGLLFTAYDFLPFFGLAAVLVLVRRRRFLELPIALVAMAAPSLLVGALLSAVFHVSWSNTNTSLYGVVVHAYLHPPGIGPWLRVLADLPVTLVENFFFGNMVFLPALALVVVAVARQRLSPAEAALAVAVAAVFLFNNLAPPYPGRWQMRGPFLARLYQPLSAALLVYAARELGAWRALPRAKGAIVLAAGVLTLAANASVAFGPIARVPWADVVYLRFYLHSAPGTMNDNLAVYGRRPLGVCAQDRKD
jgi:hypothetical protein